MKDYEVLGKWLAVCTCIIMAGILILHNHADQASGFATAAIALVILA